MSKSFRFWVRCTTVATLTVLMTFNPAWAGRGLLRFLKRSNANSCVVETTCCVTPAPCVSTPICCDSAPVISAPIIESAPCCSGSAPMMSAPAMDSYSAPIESHSFPSTSMESTAPVDTSPVPMTHGSSSMGALATPKSELSPSDATKPRDPVMPAAEPKSVVEDLAPKAPAAEVDSPFSKPDAPVVEPSAPADNDPFGANTPAVKPADAAADPFGAPTTPTTEAPAGNDPFGAPAQPAPTTATDDLFGNPNTQPEKPTAPAGDDPFGAPTAPANPASDPAADLFGNPVPETPAPTGSDPFGAPAGEPPAEPPAGEPPAAGAGNDLFGTPASDTPTSTTPAGGGDDLFGAPVGGEAPAPTAGAGDDLFGTPAPTGDAPAGGASDDLFGKPTSTDTDERMPSSFDELFGVPAEPAVETTTPKVDNAAVESDPFTDAFKSTRVWRDNTGNFEVFGVLAEIHSDKVRLLKDNGKYATVPMRRLSSEDRQLVESIANKLPAGQVKFVSTK